MKIELSEAEISIILDALTEVRFQDRMMEEGDIEPVDELCIKLKGE